jgi:MFS family permease
MIHLTAEATSPPCADKNSSAEETKVKQKTMRLSITEGSFSVVGSGIGDNYIVPFALELNASDMQIGIMTSLTGFCTPLGQLVGAHLMEKRSRKGIAVAGAFIQASTWVLVVALAGFLWGNMFVSLLPVILIIVYTSNIVSGAVSGPPWFSLMGDIVPDDQRGRYFAKRNVIVNIIAITVILLLSFMLQVLKEDVLTLVGFAAIFLIAFGSRLTSSFLLSRHYYPRFALDTAEYVRLWDFLKDVPKSNFGHFVLLATLVNFGQMIGGPFFGVHMLQNLNFSYETYILINLSQSMTAIILYPFLGKFSDKYGNVRLLRIGACIVPILPLFWIFFTDPLNLILFPQVIGGLGWTAFNLAASNFIYDSVPPHTRGFYVAYYNFLVGLGILGGGLVGSVLITIFPDVMTSFKFVFLISGLVRIAIVAIFLPKIKEVRKISISKPVSKFNGFRTARGLFVTLGLENLWKKHGHNNKKNGNGAQNPPSPPCESKA